MFIVPHYVYKNLKPVLMWMMNINSTLHRGMSPLVGFHPIQLIMRTVRSRQNPEVTDVTLSLHNTVLNWVHETIHQHLPRKRHAGHPHLPFPLKVQGLGRHYHQIVQFRGRSIQLKPSPAPK